jgi:hypothetical protein
MSPRMIPALALAAFILGATAPAQARTADPALQLVGEARLEVLLWSVYHSRLYAPGGEYAPDTRPLRLEITYLLDIDVDELIERTREEWQHLGLEHPRQEAWLDALAELWPDISARDTLSIELDRERVSHFYFNGEALGSIDDPAFGEQFLAIWLSPQTSRPALRRELLGLNQAS